MQISDVPLGYIRPPPEDKPIWWHLQRCLASRIGILKVWFNTTKICFFLQTNVTLIKPLLSPSTSREGCQFCFWRDSKVLISAFEVIVICDPISTFNYHSIIDDPYGIYCSFFGDLSCDGLLVQLSVFLSAYVCVFWVFCFYFTYIFFSVVYFWNVIKLL